MSAEEYIVRQIGELNLIIAKLKAELDACYNKIEELTEENNKNAD